MNFPGRACIRPPGSLVCTTTTCVGRIGRRYWTGAKSGIPPVRSTGVVHRGYAGCWIQPSENSILPRRSVPPVSKTFPTASLMRNHLLNTACRGRIEGRKGHKDAQKDAERHPKSRSLSEAALSDAVGIQRVEKVDLVLRLGFPIPLQDLVDGGLDTPSSAAMFRWE